MYSEIWSNFQKKNTKVPRTKSFGNYIDIYIYIKTWFFFFLVSLCRAKRKRKKKKKNSVTTGAAEAVFLFSLRENLLLCFLK